MLKRSGSSAHTGMLYFLPPHSAPDGAELLVSTNHLALVHLDEVEHVTLSHLSVLAGRGSALSAAGSDLTFSNLRISDMGIGGISASGKRITITSTELAWIGGKAIQLDGGVRKKLVSGDHRVEFSYIHHSPRRSLHYGECIDFSGVGHTAHGNLIHTSPSAIGELYGNDFTFTANTIHHVALDTFDTGAVNWAAFDPTQWGHQFHDNFFAMIGHKDGTPCSAQTSCVHAAIYADDGSFGFNATGNVIWIPLPEDGRSIVGHGNAGWFNEEVGTMGFFVNGGGLATT